MAAIVITLALSVLFCRVRAIGDLDEGALNAASTCVADIDEHISLLQVTFSKGRRIFSQPLNNLQWLHIPKAGTSFIATLWNFGCGQGNLSLDLNVDPLWTPNCRNCYDFAIMERYPKENYCRSGVFNEDFETQHQPITLAQIAKGVNVVGFFRSPNQRIVSAFNEDMHANGFSDESYDELLTACENNVTCFANFPGIVGCATRMLTNGTCASDSGEIDNTRIGQAIETVHKMVFVGVTEHWDESVCLFHLMFGSRLHPAELKDWHSSNVSEAKIQKETSELEQSGFVDSADEAVYAAAKKRYAMLLSQYVPKGTSACVALHERDADSSFKASRSPCKTANVECGSLADKFDCGVCPMQRLQFLKADSTVANIEPTCNPHGKCNANGQQLHDVFSWELPDGYREHNVST